MKENTISVEFSKSPEEVFEFTINPENTHKWIKRIAKEQTNEYPVRLGTVYRNVDRNNVWTEYRVVKIEKNKVFELKEIDGSYSVRYTYEPLKNGNTRLIYFEKDETDLKNPFEQKVLEELKSVLEEKF